MYLYKKVLRTLSLRVRSPVVTSIHDVLFVRFISSGRCCHVICTRSRIEGWLKVLQQNRRKSLGPGIWKANMNLSTILAWELKIDKYVALIKELLRTCKSAMKWVCHQNYSKLLKSRTKSRIGLWRFRFL